MNKLPRRQHTEIKIQKIQNFLLDEDKNMEDIVRKVKCLTENSER